MHAKSLFLVVTLLLIQSCYSQLYSCMDKSIIEDDCKLVATNGDVNLAYNEVGSCATLQTLEDDDDDEEGDLHFCCYAKLIYSKRLFGNSIRKTGRSRFRI